ncbi:MAG: hypothetical protein U5K77_03240 [Candidatus Saccharibacteria bacterium]|nr:hypothetical protein [Candidatus Saccharibacteria bacterium]
MVEKTLGFVVVLAVFVGGAAACGYYIWQDAERQRGALALAIGLTLIICGWFWVTKDRSLRTLSSDD